MAYPNSLLLIAFFLVATTSVANCQPLGATVYGFVRCNINFPIVTINPTLNVNAALLCNGTRVAPVARINLLGGFFITVDGSNATLVNAANCRVIVANVTTPLGGCPTINSSQVLAAPIRNLLPGLPNIIPFLRTFVTGTFSPVGVNATISA